MDQEPAAPAPSPAPADAAPDFEPAGFWVRGGAFLVDSVILALGGLLPVPGAPILIGLAYKTVFVSQGGQTPGKMAAGLRVIRADGEPVAVGRSLGRALAEYLSGMLLGLGYVIAAFGEKRALHDHVAGTRVVFTEAATPGRRVLFTVLGVLSLLVPLALVAGMAYLGLGSFGKFKELSVKSDEGATKGGLGSLRAATSIFYGDKEGEYPKTLDELVGPVYIEKIPQAKTADHPASSAWTAYGAEVCTGSKEYGQEIDPGKLKDTGGWGYVNDPQAPCYGQVFVDCSHKDTKGKTWTEY